MSIKSIGKKETVYKVLSSVIESKRTTRSRLAEDCGISFVTAGKIVDHLIDVNILKQSFTHDNSAQRKSNIISIKQHFMLGICTITPERMTFSVCDLSGKELYSYFVSPIDPIIPKDTLNFFVKEVESIIKEKIPAGRCIGISVIINDPYDCENDKIVSDTVLNGLSIKESFRQINVIDIRVLSSHEVINNYVKSELNDSENSMVLLLERNSLKCGYLSKQFLQNAHLRDFGHLKDRRGLPLIKSVKSTPDPDSFVPEIAGFIYTSLALLPISKIYVHTSLYDRCDAFTSFLFVKLLEFCEKDMIIAPPVLPVDINNISLKAGADITVYNWFWEYISK